ncbi:P-loop containing nucleoside triphosphate hydrolase protein [Xylaria arbuscula]|nr:P-loop containing nucleoside triphosphate hydrolase protein [Xylaria arbuscula]
MAAATKTAATAATVAADFIPRTIFEVSPQITRSYFLGHHTAALSSMRKTLSNIGLVLECRDSRVPLTSGNPLLESCLAGRERIIVYTKADLCAPASANRWMGKQQRLLEGYFAAGTSTSAISNLGVGSGVDASGGDRVGAVGAVGGRTEVIFTDERNARSVSRLLDAIKSRAAAHDSLIGLRALVVGMPNAGKSTLLNALRRVGMRLPSAARTGAQPGITRKLSTPVRIVAPTSPSPTSPTSAHTDSQDVGEGVFVVDTPGVFIPYVSNPESMLKLSLVGCIKDGLVPSLTVADYLLFHLNLHSPTLYSSLSAPTNDVHAFLDSIALRTGKLLKGGIPAREQAADWVIQQWRKGALGRFGLDDVSEEGLQERARQRVLQRLGEVEGGGNGSLSMNQARKREKEARKARSAAKRAAALDLGG